MMNRAHSDEEILSKSATLEKPEELIMDGKIDIAVDLDDATGTCHTYVVTYTKISDSGEWLPSEITELSPGG